jgi:hypothetical protein
LRDDLALFKVLGFCTPIEKGSSQYAMQTTIDVFAIQLDPTHPDSDELSMHLLVSLVTENYRIAFDNGDSTAFTTLVLDFALVEDSIFEGLPLLEFPLYFGLFWTVGEMKAPFLYCLYELGIIQSQCFYFFI